MPFFTYYKTDTLNRLVAIPKTRSHSTTESSTAPWTTRALRAHRSIRAVRVHSSTASDPRTKGSARTVETMVRMMIPGCWIDVVRSAVPSGTPSVVTNTAGNTRRHHHWTKSTDDNVARRTSSVRDFPSPVVSERVRRSSRVSRRLAASYSAASTTQCSQTYVYGIAAQIARRRCPASCHRRSDDP